MTQDEIRRVEDLINARIFQSQTVEHLEMSKDQALAAGAIAFFGEKYGDQVRVIKVGDFSTELCGGTHVKNSSEIGIFKVNSESGIAAGVRRIVAFTSQGALDYLRETDDKLRRLRDAVGASSVDEIVPKLERLQAQERELRKQLEQSSSRAAAGEVDELLAKDSERVVARVADSADGIKRLRDLAERIKQKSPAAVIILGCADPDGSKAYLLAAKGPKAAGSFDSGKIISAISAYIDGRGGGKADMAQAGGSKPSGLQTALDQARKLI